MPEGARGAGAPFTAADLSVVIPTVDRWDILTRTLAALGTQTVKGFETIVVVDGDASAVPALPGVCVHVQPHAGPGAARNRGARASGRPLILFLGDDMVPEPDLVDRHLAGHRQDPAPEAAVLGRVVWHPEIAHDRLLEWLDWSGTQFDYRSLPEAGADDVGFGRFYSCNVSLKRDFFLDGGGFDEDFVFYYEDLDCGWRLADRGLRLRYEPDALFQHLHRYTWNGIQRRFEGIARGERMMQAKHPDFEPFFAVRVAAAEGAPAASAAWPYVADWLPERARSLRDPVQRRANDRYYQRLAPFFRHAWEADRSLEELREYLGDRFDEHLLYRHRHEVDAEEEAAPDQRTFYRTSQAYLYDLTAFAQWPTKIPYLIELRRFLKPGGRVLDYGCGIGTDGLALLDEGYHLAFADFDNPSTAYLRWRLARRGLEAPIYDVEAEVPGGFDAAFSFDVIEHVEDPYAFLAALETRAAIVAVNFLEPAPDDTHLHRPLPIPGLLDHAARLGLLRYRRYHGRSHFVVYRTKLELGTASRVRARFERLAGGRLPGTA
jgi:GT2 family glycosyltransferase/SAM-dependent methyltransferase